MRNFGDFKQWEEEVSDPNGYPVLPVGAEIEARAHIATLEVPRMGYWELLEKAANADMHSLHFAQAVQQIAEYSDQNVLTYGDDGYCADIDRRAVDIKSQRVWLQLADGHVAASAAGYTVDEEKKLITMRLHDLNAAPSLKSGFNKETAKRLAGPFYIPVLAISGLTYIIQSSR